MSESDTIEQQIKELENAGISFVMCIIHIAGEEKKFTISSFARNNEHTPGSTLIKEPRDLVEIFSDMGHRVAMDLIYHRGNADKNENVFVLASPVKCVCHPLGEYPPAG